VKLAGVFIVIGSMPTRDIAVAVDKGPAAPGYRWCVRWHRASRKFVQRPVTARFCGVASAEDLERARISARALEEFAQRFGLTPRLYAAERRAP
jgi:hypothetical protein